MVRKLLLNDIHKAKRLAFAKELLHLIGNNSNNVIGLTSCHLKLENNRVEFECGGKFINTTIMIA